MLLYYHYEYCYHRHCHHHTAFKAHHYCAYSFPTSCTCPSFYIKGICIHYYVFLVFITCLRLSWPSVFAHASLSTHCTLWLPHPHFQLPYGFILLMLQGSSMSSIRCSRILPVGITSSSYKLPWHIICVSSMASFHFWC